MIVKASVQKIVDDLRERLPDLIVSETDYGLTVGVTLPGRPGGIYIARVWRGQRDGYEGYYELVPDMVPEIVRQLQEERQDASPRPEPEAG